MGRWILLGVALLLGTGPAATGWTAEGVAQISQDSVEASGGFPLTITEPGSYVLTSDLVVSAAGTSGIEIEADDVTIDLNGFEIRGPVTCTGDPVSSCSPSSNEPGIQAFDVFPLDRTVVRDGTVRGFGDGLDLGVGAVVESVIALENADRGIQLDEDAIVRSSTVLRNGATGLDAGDRALVSQVVARGNGLNGISVGPSSLVSEVVAAGNDFHGVQTANDCVVRGSNATGNAQDGINAATGATIADNMTGGNTLACIVCDQCTVRGNTARGCFRGIISGGGSSVVGNTVSGGTVGIRLESNTGLGQNVITSSSPIEAVGGATFHEIGTNVCGTNTTCP